MSPPPTSPMPGRVGGAVQGMPGAAPDPKAQMAAKFQSVIAGVKEVIQVISAMPGVDKEKVQQAMAALQQGVQLLAAAIPKAGGPTPGGPG